MRINNMKCPALRSNIRRNANHPAYCPVNGYKVQIRIGWVRKRHKNTELSFLHSYPQYVKQYTPFLCNPNKILSKIIKTGNYSVITKLFNANILPGINQNTRSKNDEVN